MSATLNTFALGRGVGAIGVTPLTPNASTGVISAGTTKSILGQFKTFKYTMSNTLEDVSATSARARNMMIIDDGTKVDITGILFTNDSAATPTNPALVIADTSDYIAINCTRGGLAVTIYGILQEYSEEVKDKGSVTFSMSLAEIDINQANPAFV